METIVNENENKKILGNPNGECFRNGTYSIMQILL